MGILPIAIGFGAGARAAVWDSPSWAACFSPSSITLYITPVYYVYLDRVQNRMSRAWSRWTGRGKIEAKREKPVLVGD